MEMDNKCPKQLKNGTAIMSVKAWLMKQISIKIASKAIAISIAIHLRKMENAMNAMNYWGKFLHFIPYKLHNYLARNAKIIHRRWTIELNEYALLNTIYKQWMNRDQMNSEMQHQCPIKRSGRQRTQLLPVIWPLVR